MPDGGVETLRRTMSLRRDMDACVGVVGGRHGVWWWSRSSRPESDAPVESMLACVDRRHFVAG